MTIPIEQFLGCSPSYPDFGDISKMRSPWAKMVVSIASLIPNQSTVESEIIEIKRKGSNLSAIYVINKEGRLYILDGHHTVIAKKLNGQCKVKVNYLAI